MDLIEMELAFLEEEKNFLSIFWHLIGLRAAMMSTSPFHAGKWLGTADRSELTVPVHAPLPRNVYLKEIKLYRK